MTARDSTPPDFLAFLQERHALESSQACRLLGDWLVSYEPSPAARLHLRTGAATASVPSTSEPVTAAEAA